MRYQPEHNRGNRTGCTVTNNRNTPTSLRGLRHLALVVTPTPAPVPSAYQEQHSCVTERHAPCLLSLCDAGYHCPPGSTSPRANACGSADVYCPRGSSFPTPVDPGYYTYSGTDVGGGVGDAWASVEREKVGRVPSRQGAERVLIAQSERPERARKGILRGSVPNGNLVGNYSRVCSRNHRAFPNLNTAQASAP